MFRLDPHSGVPIYRQLMDQVRRMVASGRLQPGDELPSVRSLALDHTVNTMTISKAYSLLEAEGVLERQRGKAMRVAAGKRPRADRKTRLGQLSPAVAQLATAARQLELDVEDVLAAVRNEMEHPDD